MITITTRTLASGSTAFISSQLSVAAQILSTNDPAVGEVPCIAALHLYILQSEHVCVCYSTLLARCVSVYALHM